MHLGSLIMLHLMIQSEQRKIVDRIDSLRFRLRFRVSPYQKKILFIIIIISYVGLFFGSREAFQINTTSV
jgi:hypothetical protein